MTGPQDDGPTGFFDHLDDAAPPTPDREVLDSVVHRGRRIRARRQGAFALSGAAAVTAAVLGGLGLSHAVNADRNRDRLLPPLGSPTATASASASAAGHHGPGVAVVAPGAGPAAPEPSASTVPTPFPCTGGGPPTEAASPVVEEGGLPVLQPSEGPLVPTPSPPPCGTGSPSPSPTPSDTATPPSTPTDEPTSAPAPSNTPSP